MELDKNGQPVAKVFTADIIRRLTRDDMSVEEYWSEMGAIMREQGIFLWERFVMIFRYIVAMGFIGFIAQQMLMHLPKDDVLLFFFMLIVVRQYMIVDGKLFGEF